MSIEMEQGANILLFSKSLTPPNSMYTKKTKLVKPYFNFLIFSFVLWNSSFPAAGDESIIKKNLTEKISLRAKSKRIPEVCLAGEFKAHFHWTEELGTGFVAILKARHCEREII